MTGGTWDRWAAPPAVRAALAVHYFPGMWSWPRAVVDPLVLAAADREGATAAERAAIEGFVAWAPTVDDFTPVRVELDVDVAVVDPVIDDRALSTEDGWSVRYHERIPLLVLDEADESCWLVVHHLVDEWTEVESFVVDERTLTAAWAWQTMELAAPVVGVVHDELRLDPPNYRRTRLPLARGQVEAAGARLGRAALTMLDAAVRPDPTFDWIHCRLCPFRAPCQAMERVGRGPEVDALLTVDYRPRAFTSVDEVRYGSTSWAPGGSRPPIFGGW